MCSQTDYASLFCFCRPVAATPLKNVMTPMPLMTSSPVFQSQKSILRGTVFPSLQNVSPVKTDDSETDTKYDSCKVTIQVHWPSKVRQKTLDQDLSSLGKMLCQGTFKQIARAAWRCKKLQQHFLEEIARQIHSECSLMCKTKQKKNVKVQEESCLRKTDKENIATFSFEKLDNELQERAPLFRLVLKTASLRAEDRSNRSLQCVGVAAAVCLKNRSRNMTALQLILAIITQVSGFTVSTFHSGVTFALIVHTVYYLNGLKWDIKNCNLVRFLILCSQLLTV